MDAFWQTTETVKKCCTRRLIKLITDLNAKYFYLDMFCLLLPETKCI